MNSDTSNFQIIIPGVHECRWTEAEVLGGAVWLWMHKAPHHNLPLHSLSSLLLPAIKHRQFALVTEAGQPVFYMSWAMLSQEAEQRYLREHPVFMSETDWNSGERMWILDWVAPFGHTKAMSRLAREQWFANRCIRFLYHRGNERGLKIKNIYGKAVLPKEAQRWFDERPMAYAPSGMPADLQKTASRGMGHEQALLSDRVQQGTWDVDGRRGDGIKH